MLKRQDISHKSRPSQEAETGTWVLDDPLGLPEAEVAVQFLYIGQLTASDGLGHGDRSAPCLRAPD